MDGQVAWQRTPVVRRGRRVARQAGILSVVRTLGPALADANSGPDPREEDQPGRGIYTFSRAHRRSIRTGPTPLPAGKRRPSGRIAPGEVGIPGADGHLAVLWPLRARSPYAAAVCRCDEHRNTDCLFHLDSVHGPRTFCPQAVATIDHLLDAPDERPDSRSPRGTRRDVR